MREVGLGALPHIRAGLPSTTFGHKQSLATRSRLLSVGTYERQLPSDDAEPLSGPTGARRRRSPFAPGAVTRGQATSEVEDSGCQPARIDDRSYGLMFWFMWNRLPGSYLRLIDASVS